MPKKNYSDLPYPSRQTTEKVCVVSQVFPMSQKRAPLIKKSVGENFEEWQGKIIFLTDPDEPTIQEWIEV